MSAPAAGKGRQRRYGFSGTAGQPKGIDRLTQTHNGVSGKMACWSKAQVSCVQDACKAKGSREEWVSCDPKAGTQGAQHTQASLQLSV